MTSTPSLDDANCWCVSGVRSAEKFFRAIPGLAPEVTHMFLEGTPTPDIVALISAHAEQSQYWAPVGTIWSWPRSNQRYTVRASPVLFARLAEAAAHHAEPEICSHLHLYHEREPLVHWFDAFDDPLMISKVISRARVNQFCSDTGGVLSDAAA